MTIAVDTDFSTSTVARELATVTTFLQVKQADLPANLAFDEFRGVGHQLHFICLDNDTHRIYQILGQRDQRSPLNYFNGFSAAEGSRFQTITFDLNYHYQTMIKRLSPHAMTVLDRFHLCQMVNRAFNQLRAQITKDFDPHSRAYKYLKFGWKQYLIASDQLSTHNYYDVHLQQWPST